MQCSLTLLTSLGIGDSLYPLRLIETMPLIFLIMFNCNLIINNHAWSEYAFSYWINWEVTRSFCSYIEDSPIIATQVNTLMTNGKERKGKFNDK